MGLGMTAASCTNPAPLPATSNIHKDLYGNMAGALGGTYYPTYDIQN